MERPKPKTLAIALKAQRNVDASRANPLSLTRVVGILIKGRLTPPETRNGDSSTEADPKNSHLRTLNHNQTSIYYNQKAT